MAWYNRPAARSQGLVSAEPISGYLLELYATNAAPIHTYYFLRIVTAMLPHWNAVQRNCKYV